MNIASSPSQAGGKVDIFLEFCPKEVTFYYMRLAMRTALVIGLVSAMAGSAMAAHTRVRLVPGATAVQPGESLLAGVQMTMDPGWHTYWKNSGASGSPTTVEWDLPPGITASELLWPLPEKLPEEDLTTYVYKNQVVLLAHLQVAQTVAAGDYTIRAKVAWLECEQQCVPGQETVSTTLKVGSTTQSDPQAGTLFAWEKQLPRPTAPGKAGPLVYWEKPATGDLRPAIIQWQGTGAAADFFPYASDAFEVQPTTEKIASDAGTTRLRVQIKKGSAWPERLKGVLIEGTGKDRSGQEIDAVIEIRSAAAPAKASGLGWMLLYAFVGGLILNIMPCVLPVLALKVLGFVSQARQDPRRVRRLGLIYGAGVLASFLAMAVFVLAVKAAGHHAGWGMQFGNPQFLVALTILVTLVALNLFGLFEITPGGRIMDAAGVLASQHGAAGAFFNGVLATLLATPCTAPFLGLALGFAFTQSAPVIVLVFSVVAFGLASPYVLLSWNPSWLRFVPKPGAWMERFKIAMGFPMLATAVWLFSLLPVHYGARSWWLALFLVVTAFAAWVYGEFFQRVRRYRGVSVALVLLLLIGGFAYAVEGQLDWRRPLTGEGQAATGTVSQGGIRWEPWSPQAVEQARAQGRPVLVDFTADWCLTCQANKKFALEIPAVTAKLKAIDAVTLIGDYTRLPDAITAELARFERAGVPLVLVYPRNAASPPEVLPAALSPGIVLAALDRAGR